MSREIRLYPRKVPPRGLDEGPQPGSRRELMLPWRRVYGSVALTKGEFEMAISHYGQAF